MVNGHSDNDGYLAASLLEMPELTPAHYAAHERYEKARREFQAEETRYKDMLEGRIAPSEPLRTVWTDIGEILDLPDAKWVVPGLLADGSVNLLYGPPKSGKTLFLLGILKAASDGGDLLGLDIPPMHTWLYSEQSEYGIRPQFKMLNFSRQADMRLALKRHNMNHETTEQFADMIRAEYINANPRPSIVVIDTMASFLAIEDSNDYSAVQRGMTPLVQCAQDIGSMDGTATLLTHHDRKSTGNGSDAVLGSRAIAAAVDTLLKLTILKTEGRRRLSIQSRFGIGELGERVDIALHLPQGEYRLANDAAERGDSILDAVAAGASKRKDIIVHIAESDDAEELSPSVFNTAIKGLIEEGLLERVGKGAATQYTIPELD